MRIMEFKMCLANCVIENCRANLLLTDKVMCDFDRMKFSISLCNASSTRIPSMRITWNRKRHESYLTKLYLHWYSSHLIANLKTKWNTVLIGEWIYIQLYSTWLTDNPCSSLSLPATTLVTKNPNPYSRPPRIYKHHLIQYCWLDLDNN